MVPGTPPRRALQSHAQAAGRIANAGENGLFPDPKRRLRPIIEEVLSLIH